MCGFITWSTMAMPVMVCDVHMIWKTICISYNTSRRDRAGLWRDTHVGTIICSWWYAILGPPLLVLPLQHPHVSSGTIDWLETWSNLHTLHLAKLCAVNMCTCKVQSVCTHIHASNTVHDNILALLSCCHISIPTCTPDVLITFWPSVAAAISVYPHVT